MFYKNLIVFILFLISSSTSFSQTLVKDGGFEDINLTINKRGLEIYNYTNWKSLLPIEHLTKRGAPHYPTFLDKLKLNTINNNIKISDYQPFEGNSYLTCIIPSLRNLYQSKLVKPVKKDKVYRISFMLKIISDYYKKNKVEKAVKKGEIGVLLTTSSQNDSIRRKLLMNPKIKINPTIKVDNYSYSCEEQWISFSETWRADKDYNYVIVGNFEPLLQVDEIGYRTIKGVTYRIDNLKIEKLSDNETFILGKEIITDCSNKGKTTKEKNYLKIPQFENITDIDYDLKKYYQTTHQAEKELIENNYVKASMYYFESYNYRKPFFKDYFNLKNILKLDTVANREKLQLLMDKKYRFNPKDSILYNKKDSILYNKIDSIFSLDQVVRHSNKSIKVQDSLNCVFLVNLYVKNTELSEYTLGANGMIKLKTILLHLTRYKSFNKLYDYLYKATLFGEFYNRDFAFLMDSYIKNNNDSDDKQSYYCTDCAIPIYSKFVIPIIDTISLNKYNNRRKSIYMESLDEQYKKQYYNFKHGYKLVNFYEIISMFPTDKSIPESQKKKFHKQEDKLIEELKEQYGNIEIW